MTHMDFVGLLIPSSDNLGPRPRYVKGKRERRVAPGISVRAMTTRLEGSPLHDLATGSWQGPGVDHINLQAVAAR